MSTISLPLLLSPGVTFLPKGVVLGFCYFALGFNSQTKIKFEVILIFFNNKFLELHNFDQKMFQFLYIVLSMVVIGIFSSSFSR